ncbi:MAG: choice-of-anchor R domain-containing protein [Zwartia sp.]
MNFRRTVLRAAFFFFVSTVLNAEVLFDSTVNPIFAFDVVSSSPSIHASFSTGAQPTQLTELKLLWRREKMAAGTVDISIHEDQQSQPGHKLETVASADVGLLPVGQQWLVIQIKGTKALSANTRYWLEITATGAAGSIAYSRKHKGSGALTEFYKNAYGLRANSETGPYIFRLEGAPSKP